MFFSLAFLSFFFIGIIQSLLSDCPDGQIKTDYSEAEECFSSASYNSTVEDLELKADFISGGECKVSVFTDNVNDAMIFMPFCSCPKMTVISGIDDDNISEVFSSEVYINNWANGLKCESI